jgi:hypothetical protein
LNLFLAQISDFAIFTFAIRVFSYPCPCCRKSFPTVLQVLTHAAVRHFASQLEQIFNIQPHDGATCPSCRHTFHDNAELLIHLGLAHGGLLQPFLEYKMCGSRILQKVMERHRLAEGRLYYCRLCPDVKYSNHEHVVEHVTTCHLTEAIRKHIEETLRWSIGEERLTCARCFKHFESRLDGLLHLEQSHKSLFGGQQAYTQLINQEDRPICLESLGHSSNANSSLPVQNSTLDSSQHSADVERYRQNFAANCPHQNPARNRSKQQSASDRSVQKLDADSSQQGPLVVSSPQKYDSSQQISTGVRSEHSTVAENLQHQSTIPVVLLGNGQNPYLCSRCTKINKSRFRLYYHYAECHFKDELLAMYARNNRCPLCNIKVSSVSNILSHMGVGHDLVENFLEKMFHVPRETKAVRRRLSVHWSEAADTNSNVEDAVMTAIQPKIDSLKIFDNDEDTGGLCLSVPNINNNHELRTKTDCNLCRESCATTHEESTGTGNCFTKGKHLHDSHDSTGTWCSNDNSSKGKDWVPVRVHIRTLSKDLNLIIILKN